MLVNEMHLKVMSLIADFGFTPQFCVHCEKWIQENGRPTLPLPPTHVQKGTQHILLQIWRFLAILGISKL